MEPTLRADKDSVSAGSIPRSAAVAGNVRPERYVRRAHRALNAPTPTPRRSGHRTNSHPSADAEGKEARPEIGTQAQFRKKKPPKTYTYETLRAHRKDTQETLDLFGDPQRSITDQMLRAYEHRDRWVNRMILGDSLVVMNSLLEYEGIGQQVQSVYIYHS